MDNDRALKLSFILPVYNVGAYLGECIESLFSQGLSEDAFEVVCINDGSTDNSLSVLEDYARIHNNVRIITQENAGVSVARNRGINEAKGEYIWFVDPDDFIADNAAKNIVDYLSMYDLEAVMFCFTKVAENTSREKAKEFYSKGEFSLLSSEQSRAVLPFDIYKKKGYAQMCSVCAVVLSRDFVKRNNLHFVEGMIAQEDTLFYYYMQRALKKVGFWSSCIYFYRQRNSSVMNSRSEKRSKLYANSLLKMIDCYQATLKHEKDAVESKILKTRIIHATEGVVFCLLLIKDDVFVDGVIKLLKEEGLYPYPFRWSNWHIFKLATMKSRLMSVSRFFIPIEVYFRLYRWILLHIYK